MVTTDDAELTAALEAETIAVVGCSATPGKAAHGVPKYLQEHGYRIVPVNPTTDEVLGEPAYDSLSDVEETVDLVDVFRPSAEVSSIVDETLDREDVDTVWLQLGIRDGEAGERVTDSGRRFIHDKCLKVEHQRLA
ncbi:CoA-binding protein [Halosegnis rubeus]|uniref:CoA-binding protein n=1 Tax=Halosegnis rubeus TaxID=2212850 RepID=A0A5N5U8P2_9EURY|nr:CoA-binding protein [Halosegnis rubeus]KAB7514944.1 CoA-binding protein [Halosegnis rubeus]KAB7518253.1 CoA-binding protein [Halosegnis rubeus]